MSPLADRLGNAYQRDLALVAMPYAAWGSVGVFVRHIDLSPTAISAWRLLFAVAMIALMMSLKVDLRRFAPGSQRWVLILIGIVLGLAKPLFLLALIRTDIGVAVVVAFSWPLWHTLLAWLLRGERQPPSVIFALGLCLAGLAMVALRSGALPRGDDAIGIGAALAASVLAAVQLFLVREVDFEIPALTVNLWQTAVASLMLLPFAIEGVITRGLSATELAILLLIGGVFTGLGGAMQVAGARRLNPSATAVVSYLEPLVATFLGILLLGERPRVIGGFGLALVLGSGMFILLQGQAYPASQPPSTGTNAPVT
jgi:drug/metabolite transporter (DMT)-like permease